MGLISRVSSRTYRKITNLQNITKKIYMADVEENPVVEEEQTPVVEEEAVEEKEEVPEEIIRPGWASQKHLQNAISRNVADICKRADLPKANKLDIVKYTHKEQKGIMYTIR